MTGWPLTLRGTSMAALAVGCIVAGELLGLVSLVAFGVFCVLALAAAVVIVALPTESTTAHRTISPQNAMVGERIAVSVRLVRRGAGLRILQDWSDESLAGIARASDAAAPGGLLRYDLVAARRGEIVTGPMVVATTDPFGFIVRRDRVGERETILVAPAAAELDPWLAQRDDADGLRPQRRTAGLDDISSRPHAPGDAMRRIHWRATARRDELMVRQEESGAAPQATILLDRRGWSPVANIVGLDATFERAVAATASLAVRFGRDGFDVTLREGTGALLAEPLSAADAADPHLVGGLLAMVTADDRERDTLESAHESRGPLVVVSADGAGIEALSTAGTSAAVLVRCVESTRPVEAPGWLVIDAPPSVDLTDAWRGGGR